MGSPAKLLRSTSDLFHPVSHDRRAAAPGRNGLFVTDKSTSDSGRCGAVAPLQLSRKANSALRGEACDSDLNGSVGSAGA